MKRRDLELLHEFNILYIEGDDDVSRYTAGTLEDFVKNILTVKRLWEF